MNSRFSLKVEFDLMEQVFKFRDGQFSSVQDFKESLSTEFYQACFEQFRAMNRNRMLLNNDEPS